MKAIYFTLLAVISTLIITAQNSQQTEGTTGSMSPDYSIGNIMSAFNVTSDGAASYNIPIDVLPGRNGMIPGISLYYNSNNSVSGLLGKGWGISGISSITRDNSTNYYEGNNDNVDFDNDALNNDGKRMLLMESGIYSFEDAPAIRIKSMTGAFGVYYLKQLPDGTTIEYGNSEDSRLEYSPNQVSDVPLTWYINKITDCSGNSITYNYYKYETYGGLIPQSIVYTGYQGQGGQNKIVFIYDNSDIDEKLTNEVIVEKGGQIFKSKNKKILTAIQLKNYNESLLLKEYKFSYQNTEGLFNEYYLKEVNCLIYHEGITSTLKPLKFEWEFYSSGYQQEELVSATPIPGSEIGSIYTNSSYNERTSVIDFDGDNKEDYVFYRNQLMEPYENEEFEYYLSVFTDEFTHEITIPVNAEQGKVYLDKFASLDWNYDGKDELVFSDDDGLKIITLNPNNDQVQVVYSNSDVKGDIKIGDVTGDGLLDIIVTNVQGKIKVLESVYDAVSNTYSFNLSSHFYQALYLSSLLSVSDFNGDGAGELLVNTSDNYLLKEVSYNSATGFTEVCQLALNASTSTDKAKIVYCDDFNADGKTDIYFIQSSVQNQDIEISRLYLSFGNSFDNPVTINISAMPSSVQDINRDGRSDLLFSTDMVANVFKLTAYFTNPDGKTFTVKDLTEIDLNHFQNPEFTIMDYDGNGMNDIVTRICQYIIVPQQNFHAISNIWVGLKHNNTFQDVIYKFTDCNEVERIVDYGKSDNSQQQYIYPQMKLKTPQLVVEETYIKGSNSTKWDNYTYLFKDNVKLLNGKGILGFMYSETTSINNNITIQNTYGIEAPNNKYYVKYMSVNRKYSLLNGLTDKLLSENFCTTVIKENISACALQYIPVDMLLISRNWDNDLDHSYFGITVREQLPEDINTYGARTRFTIYKDETATTASNLQAFNWREISEIQYKVPDYSNWILNQPVETNNTTLHNGIDPNTSIIDQQKTIVHYYAVGSTGWPFVQYIEKIPNNNTLRKTESWFTYDMYGNKLTETVKTMIDGQLAEKSVSYEYNNNAEYQSRFLTQKTVHDQLPQNNLIEQYAYETTRGLIVTSTNSQGLTTTYHRNYLGQVDKTTLPDNSYITTEINFLSAGSLIPGGLEAKSIGAEYYKLTYLGFISNSEQWNKSVTFYNKYGQPLRNETQRLNGGWNYIDQVYDSKGRLLKTSEPFFSTASADLYSSYEYDAIGRMYKTTLPTGAVVQSDFQGLSTKTTNQSTGQWKRQTYDAAGNIINASDPSGAIEYYYNAASQPLKISTQGNNVINTYDDAGFNVSTTTADMGTVSYVYNNFGQLASQTDARQNNILLNYDQLGRLSGRRVLPDNERSEYIYCQQNENGFGNIKTITKNLASGEQIVTLMTYDNLGRPKTKTERIDRQEFTYVYDYHPVTGMLQYITYPVTNYKIRYDYNNIGFMYQIVENATGKVLWKEITDNARGQIIGFELGNGTTSYHHYDKYGLPLEFITGKLTGKGADSGSPDGEEKAEILLQDQHFNFDKFTGNLTSKMELTYNNQFVTELYTYDNVLKERLETWGRAGGTVYSINYASNGNIQSKSDVTATGGSYNYGNNAGPHAVTGITNPTPQYKSQVTNQNIQYNAFNKVKQIPINAVDDWSLNYGNDDNRIKMAYRVNGTETDTYYYLDNFEVKKMIHKGITSCYHYLYAPTGLFAIAVVESGIQNTSYIHTDYQGSYSVVTDERGNVIDRLSYDPWGRRRNPVDYSLANVPTPLFNRGYTGHEHLDALGLINMNGRVYDPALGRFLSPDVVIQNAVNNQDYNAYSYCLNNPLKYTDPSGYIKYAATWPDFPGGGGGGTFNYSTNSGLPGSGHHWSNNYMSVYNNFVAMDASAFQNYYGLTQNQYNNDIVPNYRALPRDSHKFPENSKGQRGFYTRIKTKTREVGANDYSKGDYGNDIAAMGELYSEEIVDKWVGLDNAQVEGGDINPFSAYWHYKFGLGTDYHVDISQVDWKMLSERDFPGGVGSIAQINIFNIKPLSTAGIVFGDIRLQYLGNNMIKVVDNDINGDPYFDTYNYNVRWGELLNGDNIKRNVITGFGWIGTNYPCNPFDLSSYGGYSYKIIFHGTGTIGGGQ